MRYVAAALLVNMAGNELTPANIQRILESVGVECEDDKLQIVLDQLKGKVTPSIIFKSTLKFEFSCGFSDLNRVPLADTGPIYGIQIRSVKLTQTPSFQKRTKHYGI
jgi:hypothetical protein